MPSLNEATLKRVGADSYVWTSQRLLSSTTLDLYLNKESRALSTSERPRGFGDLVRAEWSDDNRLIARYSNGASEYLERFGHDEWRAKSLPLPPPPTLSVSAGFKVNATKSKDFTYATAGFNVTVRVSHDDGLKSTVKPGKVTVTGVKVGKREITFTAIDGFGQSVSEKRIVEVQPNELEDTGWRWPFPLSAVTCPYGCYYGHTGEDFGSSRVGLEAPVHAIGPGTVVAASLEGRGFWNSWMVGNCVVVDHGIIEGIRTYSTYMHLNRIDVQVGQKVNSKTRVGLLGFTGNVQPVGPGGAHLHLEVSNDNDKWHGFQFREWMNRRGATGG